MSFVGLDLNGSRARAVIGPVGTVPKPLPLDEARRELPASISLQNRHPEVGRAGLALCRQLPHLVCENFLSRLGSPHQWSAGRHRFDASKAVAAFLERIRTRSTAGKGMVLALPAYLDGKQGQEIANLAGKSKLPFLGSVPTPVALGLTAFMQAPWNGPAIVIDLDDHALTLSILTSSPGDSRHEDEGFPSSFSLSNANTMILSRCGLAAWKMRVIDGIADRCIRHSRRDPRDSGASEQMLFDQLDNVFDACRQEQMVEVVVQGSQWCQNLILRPDDVRSFCTPLVSSVLDKLRTIMQAPEAEGMERVLVSAQAWRVPGLRDVLQDELDESAGVIPLEADAAAAGAHGLAGYFQAGTLPAEHLDAVIGCPLAEPSNAKPTEKKKRLFRF